MGSEGQTRSERKGGKPHLSHPAGVVGEVKASGVHSPPTDGPEGCRTTRSHPANSHAV